MIQSELRKTARQHFFFQKASKASIMTNLNDNTAHDFSMYYPKGQNGNILNTNSKSKKKKFWGRTTHEESPKSPNKGPGPGLGVLLYCIFIGPSVPKKFAGRPITYRKPIKPLQTNYIEFPEGFKNDKF